jgi:hypothetical protein
VDELRLLDRRAGRNYTSDPIFAMAHEPEAIDPAEVDDLTHSQVARERYRHEHERELVRKSNLDRSARLRAVQNEARDIGADLGHLFAAIDAKLDEAARLLRRRRVAA